MRREIKYFNLLQDVFQVDSFLAHCTKAWYLALVVERKKFGCFFTYLRYCFSISKNISLHVLWKETLQESQYKSMWL